MRVSRFRLRPLFRSVVPRAVLLAALLFAAAGCGRVQTPTPAASDQVTISMLVEPSPPAPGPTTLVFSLRDRAGQPISDARLEVEGNMSHAGMAPVKGVLAAGQNGIYRIPFEWTMSGDWLVDVTFTLKDGTRLTRRFPVAVK
jgi:hypothetical protein